MKRLAACSIAVALAWSLAACEGSKGKNPLSTTGNAATGTVVVGSANFPENVLLAQVYAKALQAKGVKVSTKLNIGSREVIFKQIQSGALTVLPEYNGALLSFLDKNSTAATTEQVNDELKTKLPGGLELLDSAAAQDKDSITVTAATASRLHLQSIADIAPVGRDFVVGGPPEFKTRHQGLLGLEQVYGIRFKQFKPLDEAGPISVAALKKGDVQGADLFTTDPSIVENGFVVLDDPKSLFSAQNVTPLVYRAGVSDTVRTTLNQISAKLDTITLAQLVKQVVSDKKDADVVAGEWLGSIGLG
jgi:osmoprotectant transport system substrate-binding protein